MEGPDKMTTKDKKALVGIVISKGSSAGMALTKNLLRTGKDLNIFNVALNFEMAHDPELLKYPGKFTMLLTARAVLIESKTIFLCLTDEKEIRRIITTGFEINEHINVLQNKDIINVSNIQPDFSKEVCEIVEKNGGKYLELAIHGYSNEPELVPTTLLTAGNEKLFQEIKDCLTEMGHKAYYLGAVGYASKFNLILQMIKGVNQAFLGDIITYIESQGIDKESFVKALGDNGFLSDFEKSKLAPSGSKTGDTVKEVANNLSLGNWTLHQMGQSMSTASKASEMFMPLLNCPHKRFDALEVFSKIEDTHKIMCGLKLKKQKDPFGSDESSSEDNTHKVTGIIKKRKNYQSQSDASSSEDDSLNVNNGLKKMKNTDLSDSEECSTEEYSSEDDS